jgi:hypothetical protein
MRTLQNNSVSDNVEDWQKPVQSALQKIEQAQRLVESAASDLSSVRGFAAEHAELCNLSNTINAGWHDVDVKRGGLAALKSRERAREALRA